MEVFERGGLKAAFERLLSKRGSKEVFSMFPKRSFRTICCLRSIIREQAAYQMAELIACEEKGQESFTSKSFELDNCWISRTLVRFRKLACAIDHGFPDF